MSLIAMIAAITGTTSGEPPPPPPDTTLFSGRTATGFSGAAVVAMDTVVNDPESIYDSGTKKLTIPRDGFYQITALIGMTGGTGSESRLSFNRTTPDTPFYAYLTRVASTTSGSYTLEFTDYMILRTGDVVYWEFYPVGGSRGIDSGVTNSFTITEMT